jgi:hypothetical protein
VNRKRPETGVVVAEFSGPPPPTVTVPPLAFGEPFGKNWFEMIW